MINGKISILGLKLLVVTIIWGLNCLIVNVNIIVIIIIIAPLLRLWSVYPMQGCDDISPQMFCLSHARLWWYFTPNVLSQFVWWGAVPQYLKCHHSCVVIHNYVHLQEEFLFDCFFLWVIWCVEDFSKMIHGSCHVVISFDPTLTLGIKDLGRCRYGWLVNGQNLNNLLLIIQVL